MATVVLDAGALIGIDRRDRKMLTLLARAAETNATIVIPAGVLAQVIRTPARQALVARLLRQPTTDVVSLDRVDATAVGLLLASSGTSDVVDAHVVICARRVGGPILTSDPDDIALLDSTVPVVVV